MKFYTQFLGAVASVLLATTGAAHAVPVVPEPGSIGLVALGVAGLVYFSRRK